ncbi:hypothetical protein VTJ49DRAFT_5780 [Mycothermus thermophilus]|uniref:Uncharacterized protein n=1 Tax=Humicola insolens TaxID=85995 RepID=A0ABR3VQ51_HUMIN
MTMPKKAEIASLVTSGAIFVYGVDGASTIKRWRDSHTWTDRRGLGNGFDLYRELAKPNEATVPAARLNAELALEEELYPYGGAHLGYAVVNYFTLKDVVLGRLPRPRHAENQLHIDYFDLSNDFWDLQPLPGGHREIPIANDGGISRAFPADGWKNPSPIPRPQQQLINLAGALPGALLAPAAVTAPVLTTNTTAEEEDNAGNNEESEDEEKWPYGDLFD